VAATNDPSRFDDTALHAPDAAASAPKDPR
jgi:hypothetical protein